MIISSQPDEGLIALLNRVLPDCEIRVASSRTEAFEEALTTAEALGISCSRYGVSSHQRLDDGDLIFKHFKGERVV